MSLIEKRVVQSDLSARLRKESRFYQPLNSPDGKGLSGAPLSAIKNNPLGLSTDSPAGGSSPGLALAAADDRTKAIGLHTPIGSRIAKP